MQGTGGAENARAVMGGNGAPQSGNWVAVDRDVRFHPVVGFLDEDGTPRRGVVVCEMVAWLDLVMEANWRDREVNNKGKVMVIERGQLMAARNWLARRWGWSEDKVRWFFKKLATEGMITIPAPKTTQPVSANRAQSKPQRRAHFANVITICNYNTYQAACELDALLSTQSNTQSTPKQHPHHNKETREQEISPTGDGPIELLLEPEAPRMTASVAAREAFELYNQTALRCGLPKAQNLSDSRKRALALRVKEAGGMDGFRRAMANIERSAFLQGRNDRGWRADIDWLCQPSSFMRLLEGGYGNGAHAPERGGNSSPFKERSLLSDDDPPRKLRPRCEVET
jgi:hypothetical protein